MKADGKKPTVGTTKCSTGKHHSFSFFFLPNASLPRLGANVTPLAFRVASRIRRGDSADDLHARSRARASGRARCARNGEPRRKKKRNRSRAATGRASYTRRVSGRGARTTTVKERDGAQTTRRSSRNCRRPRLRSASRPPTPAPRRRRCACAATLAVERMRSFFSLSAVLLSCHAPPPRSDLFVHLFRPSAKEVRGIQ